MPGNGGKKPKRAAKHIAMGGVFSALSIVVLLLGGMLPIATFTAPVFASLCLVPVVVELGAKTALLAYAAISLLALFLVPDQELVLFFVLLTGYYPVVQPHLNKLKSRVLRWLLKLLMFNAAVAAVYALLLLLFTSADLRAELAGRGWWFWALLLAMGNVTFLLYDVLVDKVRIIYIHKIRNRLFRG